jgi:hypothetical protein
MKGPTYRGPALLRPPIRDTSCMSIYLRLLILTGVLLRAATASEIAQPTSVSEFLQDNCIDCHDGSEAEGGLDLALLGTDLRDPSTMARWVQVYDRVQDGEMPPADMGELDASELATFVDGASTWLVDSEHAEHASLGRVRSRRLTNAQLERTLHDLVAIDLPLASLMPEEQRTDGFTNIADSQSMSHFQLETHLTVVDAALDAAFERILDETDAWKRRYTARDLARANPRRRCRDPEMIDGKAVVWSAGLIFYGRITSTTVRRSGWYRITFSASAMNKPEESGVWCTVRSGRCTSGAPLLSWIGSFEATDEPSERTFEAWIPAGHMLEIRPGDGTLDRAKFAGGQVGAGEGGPQNVPGVALHSMLMEEIHPGGPVSATRKRLLGGLEVKVNRDRRTAKLISKDPIQDTAKQLRSFARRAFRRPISDETLAPYLQMLRSSIEQGEDPIDALRASYRAILCSSRFLYFVESPGPLDDHAIATRLSYMLGGSMPDAELAQLADEGELRDPKVLHEQVERLLQGEPGNRFVEELAGQWLDLVDIDFTEPDRKLYRDFDIIVQNAMLDETHQYLQTLLATDASPARLIDSDFTFLNSRLARYYDIDDVEGDQLRRVSLSPKSHRGGLLAQGSILKVTANGTNTSPVLRGIWVSERILGTPIPPPPTSVPAVEPDIRGSKTLREQLEKHLADASCAVCHRKIDPPGYALENFDAAGQWRDQYLQVNQGRKARGAPIEAGYKLPDGRAFDGFDEFRKLIGDDTQPLARNFAEKLLVFGTGAPVTFSDRQAIAQIVDETESHNHGLRSLLHAVVASPIFQSK